MREGEEHVALVPIVNTGPEPYFPDGRGFSSSPPGLPRRLLAEITTAMSSCVLWRKGWAKYSPTGSPVGGSGPLGKDVVRRGASRDDS